jgi:hypothetical protein
VPCDTLVKGTEFQAETLPAKQAKGGSRRRSAGWWATSGCRPKQGRQGERQAAERGRRAEERDPQGLRESPGSRNAAHQARVGCGLLRLCKKAAARRVNVHSMRRPAWAESPDDGPSLWWVSLAKGIDHARYQSYSSC